MPFAVRFTCASTCVCLLVLSLLSFLLGYWPPGPLRCSFLRLPVGWLGAAAVAACRCPGQLRARACAWCASSVVAAGVVGRSAPDGLARAAAAWRCLALRCKFVSFGRWLRERAIQALARRRQLAARSRLQAHARQHTKHTTHNNNNDDQQRRQRQRRRQRQARCATSETELRGRRRQATPSRRESKSHYTVYMC